MASKLPQTRHPHRICHQESAQSIVSFQAHKMAAFSNYQNSTYLLDSFIMPDTSDKTFSLLEDHITTTNRTCFAPNLSYEYLQEINHLYAQVHGKSSRVKAPFTCSTDYSALGSQNSCSPFMVADLEHEGDQVNEVVTPMERNKEHRGIKRERKRQKQSKHSSASKNAERRRVKRDAEPPTGYVHVRARRGEATDSHSLAERVRRKKVNMKMKLLQSLVPGCDKITGRTVVLDNIIRYVQALQKEVQFLTAKLALVDGMANDFEAMDFNKNKPASELLFTSEELHQLPFKVQSNPSHLISFNGTTPTSDSLLLHQETTHATPQVLTPAQILQQYGLAN